jgi:RNase P subunit RPR2
MPAPLASIARRWIRAFCEKCEEPTVFEVRPDWTFVCAECGSERRLARTGLLKSA